jgi:hypothetical protein
MNIRSSEATLVMRHAHDGLERRIWSDVSNEMFKGRRKCRS